MFGFKKKKETDLKSGFFVFVSLFAFVCLLGVVYLPGTGSRMPASDPYLDGLGSAEEQNEPVDPFITRNPNSKELITEPVINGDDPSLGPRDAEVNLIMFSDFDCVFCKKQYEVIKNVLGKYRDEVRLVWKGYPDPEEDSYSYQAEIAGRCAYEQGKFWEYHELLFDRTDSSFKDLAREVGLNVGKFSKCLESDEAASEVEKNIFEADSLKIAGVPYIYINKREILGEIEPGELETIIQLEIQGGSR